MFHRVQLLVQSWGECGTIKVKERKIIYWLPHKTYDNSSGKNLSQEIYISHGSQGRLKTSAIHLLIRYVNSVVVSVFILTLKNVICIT